MLTAIPSGWYIIPRHFHPIRSREGSVYRFCLSVLWCIITALVTPGFSQAAPGTPTGQDGAVMVLIPAGEFIMGTSTSLRDGGRDEYPERRMFLDAFYLDTFEVTNARYLQFMTATGHRAPEHPRN